MEDSGIDGALGPALTERREVEMANLEDTIQKKTWYLGGEVSREAAVTVLNASNSSNCFAVYKSEDHYTLSAKYQTPGDASSGNQLVDHLTVRKDNDGNYQISGQENSYNDIIEAVEVFVVTFDPPLLPALQGSSFESQISVADDPPDYDRANRVLKPDIAPLPDIASVRVDTIDEAKAGKLSPSSSGRRDTNNVRFNSNRPTYGSALPQWHRYETLHKCHPKNVCYGCCYRRRGWNGYRYSPSHKWYNCKGSGPLRVFGLLLFWLFCGLCFGCFKSCSFLGTVCLYVCCGFYDSS